MNKDFFAKTSGLFRVIYISINKQETTVIIISCDPSLDFYPAKTDTAASILIFICKKKVTRVHIFLSMYEVYIL